MALSDPTFRNYKPDQAKSYAAGRKPYADSIFKLIYDHHSETAGEFGLVLDVGCGPGIATRSLAQAFDRAIGIDPGTEMINAARSLGGKTQSGKDIQYEVATAEAFTDLDCLEPGSVDMITSAMAAHWVEMETFWPTAAKVLKPGGTIALWTLASFYCQVQRIASRLEHEILGPHELKGNRISRDLYDNLTLPWSISTPVEELPESLYVKHVFNRNGAVAEEEEFFAGSHEISLEALEKSLDTASMVNGWREANPELAATERDCVKRTIRDLRSALGGKETYITGQGVAILLFKKKA